MAELDERGVATRQGTHAPVLTGLYRERYGVRPDDFPKRCSPTGSRSRCRSIPQLTDDEQALVRELTAAF